jgi:hypothetical protein
MSMICPLSKAAMILMSKTFLNKNKVITSGVLHSNFVRAATDKASGLSKFYMLRSPEVSRIPRSGSDAVGGVCHEEITSGVPKSNFVRLATDKASGLRKFYMLPPS